MIMDSTHYTKREDEVAMDARYREKLLTNRPSKELIELFKRTPTAFISDSLKRTKLQALKNQVMQGVKCLSPFSSYRNHMAGPAITMRFVPASEGYSHEDTPYRHTEIVEIAEPGDVIVIDGLGEPYAFWGENAHRTSVKRQAAGIVVDGYCRDTRPIIDMGTPVFCTGKTMDSYVLRFDAVGYNEPINCGNVQVRPGDIVVGDDDGVLVIPLEYAEKIAETVKDITKLEKQMNDWVDSATPWKEIYPEVHARKYVEK